MGQKQEDFLEVAKAIVQQYFQCRCNKEREKYWVECEKIYDDIRSGKLVLY